MTSETLNPDGFTQLLRAHADRYNWDSIWIESYPADTDVGNPAIVEVQSTQQGTCAFTVQFEDDMVVIEFGHGSRLELVDRHAAKLWPVAVALMTGNVTERVWSHTGKVLKTTAVVKLPDGTKLPVSSRHHLFPRLKQASEIPYEFESYQ